MSSSLPEGWMDRIRQAMQELPAALPPAFLHYAIEEKIGEGAMAVVYRARDLTLGRPVAIKVLKESATLSPPVLARFLREAQAAAQISHPNVVTVHEVGEHEGRAYLVMELVGGEPLGDILAKRPLADLVAILEKISRGVAAAHARGIVHRDLKPGNIPMTAQGEPKVADFGLAHLVDSNIHLTATGAPLGTPLYMAPEQVQGRSDQISPATDVYALGAILYEMLTRRPPHTGQDVTQLYVRIIYHDPDPPRKVDPRVPRELDAVCMKALEKKPADRYANGADFADELRRYLNGEAVRARPVSSTVRVWRKAVRHRGAMVLAFILLAGAASVAGWGLWSSASAREKVARLIVAAEKAEQEGRLDEASSLYRAALVMDEHLDRARAGLKRVTALPGGPRTEAGRLLEQARSSLERARRMSYDRRSDIPEIIRLSDEAQQLLERSIGKAPDLALPHRLLGETLELRSEYKQAETALLKAIELDPASRPARYLLGRVRFWGAFLEIPVREGSIRAFSSSAEERMDMGVREILAALTGDAGALPPLDHLLGEAMRAWTKKDDKALLRFEKEAGDRFGNAEGMEEFHFLAALVSAHPGNLERLSRALEIRPKHLHALFHRAVALAERSRVDEALSDLDGALRLRPRFSSALNFRGVLRRQFKGDVDGAISDHTAAIEANPSYTRAFFNRGEAYQARGDADLAIADYSRTVQLGTHYAVSAQFNRAVLLERKDELDAAMADVESSLRNRYRVAESHHLRGRIRMAKGDAPGAVADFEKFLELSPGHAQAPAARTALEQLRTAPR